MKKNKWLSILGLLVIICAVLFIWNPWKGRRLEVDFRNAGGIVKSAQTQAQKSTSYKFVSKITIGDQIKIEILDRVIRGEQTQQLADIAWDIPKMSGTTAIYEKGKQLFIYHPLKDKWLKPDEDPTLKPFTEFFGGQLELVDPVAGLLKIDPAGKNLAVRLDKENQDSDMLQIQVIPEADAAAGINRALPPQVSRGRITSVKQCFWISRQDLLVSRYEMQATVSIFGLKTMDFKLESKAQDYNTTKINVPKQLQDKLGNGM